MANTKATQKGKETTETRTAYDEVPYTSYPYFYTSPLHLRTVGKVFGMNTPPLETARILELGCASGGNLVNFAATYPKSYTLGVDLSKVQIEDGQKRIKDLGLKNIELKAMSIVDLDESFGKFDYIITHGILSWVPDFVQDAIFEVSKKLLNPNGLAFISYNTLPGWNMVNNIRDMMLFHSGMFEQSDTKLEQAKLFLNFVNEALENSQTPYAKHLREDTGMLAKQEDHYLSHEYLEEHNYPFYFYQVMEKATKVGLAYLGDAHLNSMYIGNLPQKAMEKLVQITDIHRTEQYMDFITNRRFRCTIFTHNDAHINRAINADHLHQFYFAAHIMPSKPLSEVDINNAFEQTEFFLNGNPETKVSTTSPVIKALFYTLSENIGNPLKVKELITTAHKKLKNATTAEVQAEFDQTAGRMIFNGVFKIYADAPTNIFKISDKPKVSEVARYQLQHSLPGKFWTGNQVNELVSVPMHEKAVIELLDGKHTIDEITKSVMELLKTKQLIASSEGKPLEDEAAFPVVAKTIVDATLQKLKSTHMLVG